VIPVLQVLVRSSDVPAGFGLELLDGFCYVLCVYLSCSDTQNYLLLLPHIQSLYKILVNHMSLSYILRCIDVGLDVLL
jgi:hypothetical protein